MQIYLEKVNTYWTLKIKNDETELPIVSFDETVDVDKILELVSILSKGDIIQCNVNFTGAYTNE